MDNRCYQGPSTRSTNHHHSTLSGYPRIIIWLPKKPHYPTPLSSPARRSSPGMEQRPSTRSKSFWANVLKLVGWPSSNVHLHSFSPNIYERPWRNLCHKNVYSRCEDPMSFGGNGIQMVRLLLSIWIRWRGHGDRIGKVKWWRMGCSTWLPGT